MPYPSTYIKDVAIQISNKYSFDNSPHSTIDPKREPFIGRDEELRKFHELLIEGKGGVFLVTGYRGMGKTSFVNRALNKYKEHAVRNKLNQKLIIDITISQKQPTEAEVLKLMVAAIYESTKAHLKIEERKRDYERFLTNIRVICLGIVGFLVLFFWKHTELEKLFTMQYFAVPFGNVTILMDFLKWLLILTTISAALIYVHRRKRYDPPFIFFDIEKLFKRCYSSTILEDDDKKEIIIETINTKVSNSGSKKIESYPIASSKEIEHELTSFIQKAKSQEKSPIEFVFVIDELDKVEQTLDHSFRHDDDRSFFKNPEKAHLEQLRDRKQAVLNIIAGLKNFLTKAPAPFIFIAGREMFDASMADIADRQSSISSVFTYIFYIESFLREKHPNTSSLSTSIEMYLYYIIHGEMGNGASLYATKYNNATREEVKKALNKEIVEANADIEAEIKNETAEYCKSRVEENKLKLKKKKAELEEVDAYFDNFLKVNLLLQAFVVYLTYRSNGSPKKLIRMIQEFIKLNIETQDLNEKIYWNNNHDQANKRYLYFNYKNQQRIGFVNYIYRPFLVKYGNSFKKYSDNLIVSTSYLFDHLLKFHPFAFSLSHLELIPEVLSTNRTPALRDHIKKIIEFLSNTHIKETEIGLFDYKFYSKTINEIFYLSKTFEEESAAFNFTLDESYVTKLHVKGKLRELRSIYEKYPVTSENMSHLVFSIAYLNGVLGDLHYFDQEYDDAIVAYSDVIKPIKSLDVSSMNMRDFVLLLRYKLKLGLTFEKIKSYEESLAFYVDAGQDSSRFIIERISGKYVHEDFPKPFSHHRKVEERKSHYISSSLSDILQIVNQAFLAKMVLQEKLGLEGITGKKSAITMGAFLQLTESIQEHSGTNNTIIANFFLQVGNLLYFKNSVKAFEWDSNYRDDRNPIPRQYRDEIMAFVYQYHVPSEFIKVGDKFEKVNPKKLGIHGFRYPLIALSMYFIGLKRLLEGKIVDYDSKLEFNSNFKFDFAESKTISEVLDKLTPSQFSSTSTSLTKIHYKYVAIFLSHIGDCMLSMLKMNEANEQRDGFQVYEIFDEVELEKLILQLNLQELLNNTKGKEPAGEEIYAWIANFVDERVIATLGLPIQQPVDGSPILVWKDLEKTLDKFVDISTDKFVKLRRLECKSNTEGNDGITVNSIICYYYLSGYYFRLCGRSRSFSFQLRKILYLIRLVLSNRQVAGKNNSCKNFTILIEKIIVRKILEISAENAEHSDVHDFNKFKKHLSGSDEAKFEKFIRNNISNFPDTREAIVLNEHIRLKLSPVEQASKESLLHSDYSISTQYFRLLELTYAAKYHETRLKLFFKKAEKENDVNPGTDELKKTLVPGYENKLDILSFLHSLVSIINIMDIYDNDYLVGNSFLAYHHYRIARFFTFDGENGLNDYYISEIEAEQARGELLALSGDRSSHSIFDPSYNYEMAALYYDKSIKLHSAGTEYKRAMTDILYLEDDLNDASYHFGAAMDRFLMVNGILHAYFKKSKKYNKQDWNSLEKFV